MLKPDLETNPSILLEDSRTSPTVHITSIPLTSLSAAPAPVSDRQSSIEAGIPVVQLVLESNRPGVNALWRKHERRWALKCGYALASWWFLMITLIIAVFMAMGRRNA